MLLIDSCKKEKHFINYIAVADGEPSAPVIRQRYALCDEEARILKSPDVCYEIYDPALTIYINTLISGNGPFKVHTKHHVKDASMCISIHLDTDVGKFLVFTPVDENMGQIWSGSKEDMDGLVSIFMNEFSPSSMLHPSEFMLLPNPFTDNSSTWGGWS